MPYKNLISEERYVISHLLFECSYREISRRLGCSHTTIKREVERNGAKYSRYWYIYTIKRFWKGGSRPIISVDRLMID